MAALTEAEWLTTGDPRPLLHHLRDRAGDRTLRLLAIAHCRSPGGHVRGCWVVRAVLGLP